MDDFTHHLLDNFVNFLTKEFQARKETKHIQITGWSLKDFKVTVDIFINEQISKIFFDVREIKENQDRFSHLLSNAIDQIKEKT